MTDVNPISFVQHHNTIRSSDIDIIEPNYGLLLPISKYITSPLLKNSRGITWERLERYIIIYHSTMFGLIKSVATMVPKSSIFLRSIYTGKVKWFNNKKGYGFIVPDANSDLTTEVFVHQSSIKSNGFRFLKEGESVEFDLSEGQKGKVATNVSAPGGLPFNRVLV